MSTTGDALLAALRACPDDEATHLVYADWLLEQGDPRGELIRLQCEGKRRALTSSEKARIRTLLKKNEKTWLGPVATLTRSRVYDRGFLVSCELHPLRHGSLEDSIGHDAWSLLRALKCGRIAPEIVLRVVRQPILQWLRHVDAVHGHVAIALLEGDALPITWLGIDGAEPESGFQGELQRAMNTVKGLPALTRLDLDCGVRIENYEWVLATEIAKQNLAALGVRSTASLGLWAWWASRKVVPKTLREVHVQTPTTASAWAFCLRRARAEGESQETRERTGAWSELIVHGQDHSEDGVRRLVDALSSLDPHAMTRIVVEHMPTDASAAEVIEKSLRRQNRLLR